MGPRHEFDQGFFLMFFLGKPNKNPPSAGTFSHDTSQTASWTKEKENLPPLECLRQSASVPLARLKHSFLVWWMGDPLLYRLLFPCQDKRHEITTCTMGQTKNHWGIRCITRRTKIWLAILIFRIFASPVGQFWFFGYIHDSPPLPFFTTSLSL